MNRGLIIFLLIIGIQVVAGILSQVAKSQKQKQAQAAKRGQPQPVPPRSARAGARTTTRATGVPPQPTGTGSGTGQSRLEDLAARRKAQLEELRRRRAAASPARPGSARPTGTSPSAPGTPPAPVPVERMPVKRSKAGRPPASVPIDPARTPQKPRKKITAVGADFKAVQASEDAARRQREQILQRKHLATAEFHRREEELQGRRERQRRQQEKVRGEQVARARIGVVGKTQRARVTRMLREGGLREAILLREILDEPISLRS